MNTPNVCSKKFVSFYVSRDRFLTQDRVTDEQIYLDRITDEQTCKLSITELRKTKDERTKDETRSYEK
jgi:hypothetical protein